MCWLQNLLTNLKLLYFGKKTNTSLLIKWSSLCLTKFKRNLLKCLLDRVYRICSKCKAMHLEFNSITDMLLRNGYTLHFIQNQIRQFLDNKYYKSNLNKMSKRYSPFSYYFKIAFYCRSFTLCEKELQSFFHRYSSNNLSLNVVHNCFKNCDMFKHKEHQPKLLRRNVVYE